VIINLEKVIGGELKELKFPQIRNFYWKEIWRKLRTKKNIWSSSSEQINKKDN